MNKLNINESCEHLWPVNMYSACFYFCSVNKTHFVFEFAFKSVTIFHIFFLFPITFFFLFLHLTLLRSLLQIRNELKKKKSNIEERMQWLECRFFLFFFLFTITHILYSPRYCKVHHFHNLLFISSLCLYKLNTVFSYKLHNPSLLFFTLLL